MRNLIASLLALTLLPTHALSNQVVDLGNGVWDKTTNLEWLDLSLPAPCSLADMNSSAPGCTFYADGWQLASLDMVRTLVANAGFPLSSSPPDAGAIAFIQALGPTNVVVDGGDPDTLVTEIWGITADGNDATGYRAPYVAWFESQSGQSSRAEYGEIDNVWPVYIPEGPNDVVISYWLARPHVPAVPEPGTWMMAAAGLAGLGAWRRRTLPAAG